MPVSVENTCTVHVRDQRQKGPVTIIEAEVISLKRSPSPNSAACFKQLETSQYQHHCHGHDVIRYLLEDKEGFPMFRLKESTSQQIRTSYIHLSSKVFGGTIRNLGVQKVKCVSYTKPYWGTLQPCSIRGLLLAVFWVESGLYESSSKVVKWQPRVGPGRAGCAHGVESIQIVRNAPCTNSPNSPDVP